MTNSVHIFVEGSSDVKFISDYITHIKPDAQINLNKISGKLTQPDVCLHGTIAVTIHNLTGWTNLKNMNIDISRYKDSGDTVLVILDADTNENGGGFTNRKKQIEDYAPAKKSKIYNYMEVLLGKTSEEKKDAFRNFRNMEHWNLDAEFLAPLKNFLLAYIK